MPGTTRQGNYLTDEQDGNWIGNLFSPEDPAYDYGSVLPIRERKGDNPENPSLELAWPGMIRELAQGAKNLILGAGGEKTPLSDSSDAMSLATGGRLTSTSEAPLLALALRGLGAKAANPNDLGMFLGRRAKGFNDAPNKFMGTDLGGRFEISDLNSSFDAKHSSFKSVSPTDPMRLVAPNYKDLKESKLSATLTHPELYKNYPDLAKTNVYTHATDTATEAATHPSTRSIFVNTRSPIVAELGGKNYVVGFRDATPAQMHSNLLHEVQHLIQGKEGFAEGGTNSTVRAQLANMRSQLITQGLDAKKRGDLVQARQFNEDAGHIQRNLDSTTDDFSLYHRLAGEVEARNVQSRLLLQQVARNNGLPTEIPGHPTRTADVPVTDQLITRQAGIEASRPVNHDPFTAPSAQNPHPVEHDPFGMQDSASWTSPGVREGVPDIAPKPSNDAPTLAQKQAVDAKLMEAFERMRDRLLPKPSWPIPAKVKEALGTVDQLGFDRKGDALNSIRQYPDWAQRWDVDPNRSLKEYKAHKTIQNYIHATGGHGNPGRPPPESWYGPGERDEE